MKSIKSQLVILSISFLLVITGCNKKDSSGFSFIFMTDIHLQPELNAPTGFSRAIDSINSYKPAFVITGGDMIMDALAQKYSRADSLYNLYESTAARLKMPLHNTMGNHEIYGIYKASGAEKTHPEYGEKMFEKRLGNSYYSFEYGGWKFMILNSVEDTGNSGYIGLIDSAQIEWIKKDLEKSDPNTPIVISTHIPFITAFTQMYSGSTVANGESLVVINSKEVINLFAGHNLKLVLQGHLHTVEDIFIDGIHFITGGAVSAGWWEGPNRGYEEGFLQIIIKEDQFSWKYIDYGWEHLQ